MPLYAHDIPALCVHAELRTHCTDSYMLFYGTMYIVAVFKSAGYISAWVGESRWSDGDAGYS
jgi:hypothetical protein